MKNAKKWIALIVALCAMIGLCIPMSGTVRAANETYDFPVIWGNAPEDLGVALRSEASMNNFYDIVSYQDNDYLVLPAKGGNMYIFDLTDYLKDKAAEAAGTPIDSAKNYIYTTVTSNIGSPRGLLQVGTVVYSVGDASYVTWYNFATGKSGNINLQGAAYGLCADNDNNVYLAGANGMVYKLSVTDTAADPTTTELTPIYTTDRVDDFRSIAYYNETLYAQGILLPEKIQAINDGTDDSEIHAIATDGTYKDKLTLKSIAPTYYMTCTADGKLFLGNVGATVAVDVSTNGMVPYYGKIDTVTIDATSTEVVTLTSFTENTTDGYWEIPEDAENKATETLGIMPVDSTGISYAVISGKGLYSYNAADARFEPKTLRSDGPSSRDLRCRETYKINDSEFILTGNGSAYSTWRLSGEGVGPDLNGIIKDAYSDAELRTMSSGFAGDDITMYAGGYLATAVRGHSLKSGDIQDVFPNGHAQTDSILAYNGKIYAGAYSGAYLTEYDPTKEINTDPEDTIPDNPKELIPGGVGSKFNDGTITPKQIRIHALAAGQYGENHYIFFATVPNKYDHGGYLGFCNITTGEYKLFSHSALDFNNQMLVTLVYDEDTSTLYAGTSTRGGSDAGFATYIEGNEEVPCEAKLIAYKFDPTNENSFEKLADTTVGDLTTGDDTPRCIFGIAKDPQGTYWGLVSRSLFTFKYDESTKTITTTKQWECPTNHSADKDRYPNSGSSNWFPHQILFDDSYLYVVIGDKDYGLSRFELNDARDGFVKNGEEVSRVTLNSYTGRIYTMGSDGNIYIPSGKNIARIVVSRTTMTEYMIDNYKKDAETKENILAAYNALTENEKNQISKQYEDTINALQGNVCYYIDTTGKVYGSQLDSAMTAASAEDDKTVYLIDDYEGDVAVKAGVILDLNGQNITGDVSALNGQLIDSVGGGTITLTEGKKLDVQTNNPYMPLLDPVNKNYKLFEYEIVQTDAPVTEVGVGALNFWFDLEFTNPEAYTLLTGASNLTVSATLSWTQEGVDSTETEKIITFNNTVKSWANKEAEAAKAAEADPESSKANYGLYLQVTGIPLTGVSNITVTPQFVTDTGINITLDTLDHDVVQFAGNANVGEFPNDVIND